jgi:hypothetical protein
LSACLGIGLLLSACTRPADLSNAGAVDRIPAIFPDYRGVTVPPNIAPLNFQILEPGDRFSVLIRSERGEPMRISSASGWIKIPIRPWKRLLGKNAGSELVFEVAVRDSSGRWSTFEPVKNRVSPDSIDAYITYRKLGPLYTYWKKMGIFQRRIEDFTEAPVLVNRQTLDNCMNCHNFWKNGTDRWLMHLRGGPGTSMLLTVDGKTRKIDTRTKFNKAAAAYPAWHPAGDWLAFSVNKLLLFFHAVGENRDVLDRYSDILLYRISNNTITASPEFSGPARMENWPCWSPDGRFLYFCVSPPIEAYIDSTRAGADFAYDRIRYDLMRVPFDPETGTCGRRETVLSAKQAGGSINEPRISPDGRFVLFTLSAYSQFPIYLRGADLCLLDLTTRAWRKLDEVNSDRAETFHSWASNGRWIVFSSKRIDGLFARPHFSHVDSEGNVSAPFVLPQADPAFYRVHLDNFNVPEFSTEPIRESPRALARAAFDKQNAIVAQLDPALIPVGEEEEAKPGLVQQPQ